MRTAVVPRPLLDSHTSDTDASPVSAVALDHLTKVYRDRNGSEVVALRDLILETAPGELLALVGPSGSGKTTTLRLVAGLEAPSAGKISLEGRPMDGVPPEARGVAMVFQDHPLFPHLTVEQNLDFGLRLRRVPPTERSRRMGETSELLGLQTLQGRLPDTLSSGERQRVALGTALVKKPRLLLLDEPLAQLDTPLRLQLRSELRRFQRELQLTTILVTHDQAEAMAVADRLAVIQAGTLQQIGTPLEVYRAPANLAVAQFLGEPGMNLIRGQYAVEGSRASLITGDQIRWATASPSFINSVERNREVVVGVRPENIQLTSVRDCEGFPLRAMVEDCEILGAETLVRLRIGKVNWVARLKPDAGIQTGSEVVLRIEPKDVHWFEASTGQRI